MDASDEEIVKYLSKEMTLDEQNSFEERVIKDELLSQRISKYKTAIKSVRNSGIRREMDEIHNSIIKNGKKNRYIISGIAASILVLICVYTWFWSIKPDQSELYITYFEPYPNLELALRGEEDPFLIAMNLYTSGDYQGAIDQLSSIEHSLKASFYLAMSHMMMDNHDAALQILNSFPESSLYEQQINWYLGLTYLKQQQLAKATNNLGKIKLNEFKYEEAQNIIRAISD